MAHPSHRSSRSTRGLTTGLKLVVGVALASLAVAGGLLFTNTGRLSETAETVAVTEPGPLTAPASVELAAAAADGFSRPVYQHSVVPGGVFTRNEIIQAIAQDTVVAAHYDKINTQAIRTQTVSAPRRVYMSYRRGDKVYWTKQPLPLHRGEKTLSDGAVEIRARCGNCISDVPMTPTSDQEPDAVEFDRLVGEGPGSTTLAEAAADPTPLPSGNYGSPTSVGGLLSIGPSIGTAPMPLPPGLIDTIGGGFGGGFAGPGLVGTLAPSGTIPQDRTPAGSRPVTPGQENAGPPNAGPPADPTSSSGNPRPPLFPVGGDGPGGNGPGDSGAPPQDTYLTLPGGGGTPDDPPLGDPPVPAIDAPEVVVVPEPGTLVILGTGLAGFGVALLRRRQRARRNAAFVRGASKL
jgi:hypothetical protein